MACTMRTVWSGKPNLAVLPYHDYRKNEIEGFRGRDSHFLEMLIEDADEFGAILVIDRPVALIERIALRRPWHVKGGHVFYSGFDSRLTQVGRNVFVLNHLSSAIVRPMLMGQSWWNEAFASHRFAQVTQLAYEKLGLGRPVVLLHHPFGVQLLNTVPSGALIFDVMDNFLAFEHFKSVRPALERHYREIDARAAKIFAVTMAAGKYLFGDSTKINVLPNAVSPHFLRHPQVPHDIRQLENLPRPIIGYVGSLSNHFDVALLAHVAAALSSYSFVVVGNIISPSHFLPLKRLPNVHLVGPAPYRTVPAVLRDFDVCIAPYSFGHALAQGGESIKLYEYVAAGKPVVTTPVAGAERFEGLISTASDATAFATAIRAYAETPFRGYPSGVLDGLAWRDRFAPLKRAILEARA